MLITFNKIFYSLFLLHVLVFINSHASEIDQISETKYVGNKIISYKEIDGSIGQDEAYFTFEKLNFKNLEFWYGYAEREHAQSGIKEGLCAFQTTLELFAKQELLNESQRKLMHKFCMENKAAFEQQDKSILQELDQFFEGSLYDIWIAYATRKNPRTEDATYEDIEMVTSVFLSDAPIATPVGVTRSVSYFLAEQKPHIGLAMQLHGSWAKASEMIYGIKSYAVTYPTPRMYKIMEKTLQGKEFGSLVNGLANYPAPRPWTLINPRTGEDIEFPQPDWFPPHEDGLQVKKGHSELSAHVAQLGNSRVVIDMRALISLWDSPAVV